MSVLSGRGKEVKIWTISTAGRKQWDGCEDDDGGDIPLIEANRDSVIAPQVHWLEQSKVGKAKDAKARVKYLVESLFRAS